MHTPRSQSSWIKKTLLGVFAVALTVMGMVPAQPAHAQFAVTAPVLEGITVGNNIWERVVTNIAEFLLQAGTVALVNLASQYGNKLAADTATYIATGEWGQTPLAFEVDWGEYLENAAYGAAGEAVESIGDSFLGEFSDGSTRRLSLCSPDAPYLLYGIPAALFSGFEVGNILGGGGGSGFGTPSETKLQQRCDFRDIIDNWETFAEENEPSVFLAEYKKAFDPLSNDLSLSNFTQFQAQLDVLNAQKEAELTRRASNSFKPVTDQVSERVVTPAASVEETASISGPKAANERQNDTFNAFVASGEGIVASIAGTFLSTLADKLIEQWFTKGQTPVPAAPAASSLAFNQFSQPSAGKQAFEATYADIYTAEVKSVNSVDIVTEFLACPDEFPQQNNCTIDEKFAQAIRADLSQSAMTVAQAIEQDLIHGDWLLLPPNSAQNSQNSCWSEAYCYSNLVKLRRARILPIGWEIAALEAPIAGVSLQTVVDGFDDCNYDDSSFPDGVADDNHPYCHLIDPDWLLIAPLMQCRAKVYGPVLQSDRGAVRQEACVDDPTCVVTNENGECVGAWGYCLREKNAWDFKGNSCPAYYESCTNLTARSGANVSYLASTINNEYCTEANVGCRGYFTDQVESGSWDTAGKQIFFNKDVGTCSEAAAGCTALQQGLGDNINYLRIPPDYLGCTGDPLTDPFECGDYAQLCTLADVGCSMYTPANGDPDVPAIASQNNVCDAECVGYAQFAQSASSLHPLEEIDYFIPETAVACAAESVGCTSFTNLDSAESGGEKVEYYTDLQHCVKPADVGPDGHDLFYTWEGSDTVGFQLKSFDFVLDADAPKYLTDDAAVLAEFASTCNATIYANRDTDPNYNPDCRELFGSEGDAYYRFISQLIIVSDSCAPLRRNEAIAADVCTETGGTVSLDGACLYKALPSMSHKCDAGENLCREYTGAASASGNIIYEVDFEGGAGVIDWENASLSTEAVTVGDHALEGGATGIVSPRFVLQHANAYTITFWGKGASGVSFDLELEDKAGQVISGSSGAHSASLDAVWRQYTVGPITVDNTQVVTGRMLLNAVGGGEPTYFIDKLFVKEANGVHYLIKDSWNTPVACDSNPNDNLPGVALGCQQYSTELGEQQFLTGFNRVCREEVVGCQAFINTQNSASVSSQVFNDGIDPQTNTSNPEDDVVVPEDQAIYVVNNPEFACVAEQKGCQAFGETKANGSVDTIYLNNLPDQYVTQMCKVFENGCDSYSNQTQTFYFKDPGPNRCTYQEKVVMPDGTTRDGWFKSVTDSGQPEPCYDGYVEAGNVFGIWKNGDALYDGTVGECKSIYGGCTAFVDRNDVSDSMPLGKPYYFLNDEALDATSCAGQVSLEDGCVLFDDTANLTKKWSTQMTYAASAQNNGNPVAPQPHEPLASSDLGATFNGTPIECAEYLDLSGGCPQVKQYAPGAIDINDFVWVADSNCEPKFQACWEKLTEVKVTTVETFTPTAVGDLIGGAGDEVTFGVRCTESVKSGVVDFCEAQAGYKAVFDGAEQVTGLQAYNATAQLCRDYLDAATQDTLPDNFYELEGVLERILFKSRTKCGVNNSNIILKVNRDRVCSEWLSCKSSFKAWDNRAGEERDVCTNVGVCAEWKGDQTSGECTRWVEKKNDTYNQILTKALYTGRDTSWAAADYSGYSIFNKFQAADLEPVVVDALKNEVSMGFRHKNAANLGASGSCAGQSDGTACSYNLPLDGQPNLPVNGYCYSGRCVIGINAEAEDLVAQSCRMYPEEDSPFPPSVVVSYSQAGDAIEKFTSHQNVNTCQKFDANGNLQACNACAYQKASFGAKNSAPRYYDLTGVLPVGVCSGGFSPDEQSRDGQACDHKSDCTDDRGGFEHDSDREHGTCRYLKSTQKVFGAQGYCLEEDLSTSVNANQFTHACQTWYPATLLSGSSDIFNQYDEAGYQLPVGQGGQYYCVESSGNAWRAGAHRDWNDFTYVAGSVFDAKDDYGGELVYETHVKTSNPEYKNAGNRPYLNSASYKMVVNHLGWGSPGGLPRKFNLGACGTDCYSRVHADDEDHPTYYSGILDDANLRFEDVERVEIYIDPESRVARGGSSHDYLPTDTPMAIFTDGRFNGVHEEGSGPVAPGRWMSQMVVVDDADLIPDGDEWDWEEDKTIRLRWFWENDYVFTMDETILKTKMHPNAHANVGKGFCPTGDPDWHRMLVDVVFDANTGKLTAIEHRMCDAGNGDANVNFAVIFYLREYCTEVAQVYDPEAPLSTDSDNKTNLAWTDRVNSYSTFWLGPPAVLDVGAFGPSYSFDQDFLPFGSAHATSPPIKDLSESGPPQLVQTTPHPALSSLEYAVPWYVATDSTEVIQGAGLEYLNAGSPLSCQNNYTHNIDNSMFVDGDKRTMAFVQDRDSCRASMCIGGEHHGAFCNSQEQCPPKTLETMDGMLIVDSGVCMGIPLGDANTDVHIGRVDLDKLGPTNDDAPESGTIEKADARQMLQNIFARVYNVWTWQDNKYVQTNPSSVVDPFLARKIVSNENGFLNHGISNEAIGQGGPKTPIHPPRVNAVICTASGCQKGDDKAVGVNGQEKGFIVSNGSSMVASVEFYADVADNQMPITEMAVKWNSDYEENGNIIYADVDRFAGKYKNRVPSCSDEGDKFGAHPDACSDGFYQFIHYYSFGDCAGEGAGTSNTGLVDDQNDGLYVVGSGDVPYIENPDGSQTPIAFEPEKYGFLTGDRYCAFRPRVQIMDNWNWCNAKGAGSDMEWNQSGISHNGSTGAWQEVAANPDKGDCKDPKNFNYASAHFEGLIIVKEEK